MQVTMTPSLLSAYTLTSTMVLKIYGVLKSTCCQRVATILGEKNVPYELIEVNFAEREHKSPEYLAKQPFGQVPYIVCDSCSQFSMSSLHVLNLHSGR
jgi:glutathione S-transferase